MKNSMILALTMLFHILVQLKISNVEQNRPQNIGFSKLHNIKKTAIFFNDFLIININCDSMPFHCLIFSLARLIIYISRFLFTLRF